MIESFIEVDKMESIKDINYIRNLTNRSKKVNEEIIKEVDKYIEEFITPLILEAAKEGQSYVCINDAYDSIGVHIRYRFIRILKDTLSYYGYRLSTSNIDQLIISWK